MVKLDVSLLRYLSSEDFKVLTSVEMGMRNHELVPGTLVSSIATLRFGGCGKLLVDLTKHKLLAYERGKRYDGYRLTYAGYDYLALNVLLHREILGGVGNQIGVGKESDVFICQSPDQLENYAIKFHRLGRVCFRKVTEKRDFYTKSNNKTSWIYLSRKAAQREYEFLRFMYDKGMPVPKPIDQNRHVVVMELIDGRILNHYTLESFDEENREKQIEALYRELMDLIVKFATETRVIHGDFNEFNILIKHNEENDKLEPIIIDLPQMIGIDHELAPEQFDRDVECIVNFFNKRFHYESDYVPQWSDIELNVNGNLEFSELTLDEDSESESDSEEENRVSEVNTDNEKAKSDRASGLDKGNLSIQRFVEANYGANNELNSNVEHGSDDDDDNEDESSEYAPSCTDTIETIVDPLSARRKLMSEISKKEGNRKRRQAAKPKNTKGDANPVRRRRKTNKHIACEDTANFKFEF